MTSRARCGLALATVTALTVAAYLPSFAVPFQFDDFGRIGENIPLQEGDYVAALQWLGNSRVVPSLTVIGNYLAGGIEPFGYHLVNLATHLIAACGVFALALALCRTPRLRDSAAARHPLATATVAALIFALHPLQTQAVTYIIQRYASMAAMLYVWSVVWYLRGRARQSGAEAGAAARAFAISAALAIAAVLSKENAISLPIALLLTEWTAYGRLPSRRVLVRGALLLLALGLMPLIWKFATWRPIVPGAETLPLIDRLTEAILQRTVAGTPIPALLPYLLTEATVIPRYFLLVVRPWGLNVDHDVPIASGLSAPVVGGALLLAAILGAGLAAVPRLPLIGYGIVWVFVALSVESSLLPISDVMMEHRMYLAMPGVALLCAGLFAAGLARAPRLAAVAAGTVTVALLALTFARNVVWQSPLTLWLDAVEKSPAKARVHVNAGVAYHGAQRLNDAVAHYCEALRLDPEIALAEDNLEIALEAQGKLDEIAARLVAAGAGEPVPGAPEGSIVVEVDVAGSYCPR